MGFTEGWTHRAKRSQRGSDESAGATRASSTRVTPGDLARSMHVPTAEERMQARARTVDRAIRWGAGGLAGLMGVVMLSIAGSNATAFQNEYSELVATNSTVEQRKLTYEEDAQNLPDTDEGRRLMARMREQTRVVTDAQNSLLRLSGPLSYKGIPTTEPDPHSGLDRKMSPETRRDLAQQKRDGEIAESRGASGAQFVRGDSFNPADTWSDLIGAADGVDRKDLRWSSSTASVYSPDASIGVVWTLHKTGDKSPLGWVSATYDPQRQLFVDQSITQASAKKVSS